MLALRKVTMQQYEQQKGARADADVPALAFTEVPLLPLETLSLCVNLVKLNLVSLMPPLKGELMLPSLPKLRTLGLEGNEITGLAQAFAFPSLVRLLLSNNKVESVDGLKPLAKGCPRLEVLDLVGNKVDKQKEVHTELFKLLPSLQVVSDKNADGEAVEVDFSDCDDEGEEEEYSDSDDEDEEEEDDEDIDDDDDDMKMEKAIEMPDTDEPVAKKQRTED